MVHVAFASGALPGYYGAIQSLHLVTALIPWHTVAPPVAMRPLAGAASTSALSATWTVLAHAMLLTVHLLHGWVGVAVMTLVVTVGLIIFNGAREQSRQDAAFRAMVSAPTWQAYRARENSTCKQALRRSDSGEFQLFALDDAADGDVIVSVLNSVIREYQRNRHQHEELQTTLAILEATSSERYWNS